MEPAHGKASTAKTPSQEAALALARAQPPAKIRPLAAHARQEGWRETVESVVVAFVLAFLFRTFIAEAFVIPTGSMAETLYGRHKDIACHECGTTFRVGASEEVDRDRGRFRERARVKLGVCPNCRAPRDIYPDLAFKGDRILVNKFPYEFKQPRPWDVVVFKYPDDPKTNYIKRMIGLPGETIIINHGDIYTRTERLGATAIRRKPLHKQREMQMLVYDNDRPAQTLLKAGYPERWQGLAEAAEGIWSEDPDGWKADAKTRSFSVGLSDSKAYDHRWLRYRNYVPSQQEWEDARQDRKLQGPFNPLLVCDFYSYNSGQSDMEPGLSNIGTNWVGDLTLNCEAEVRSNTGEIVLELVESLRRYRCAIDLQTGKARIYYLDHGARGGADGTAVEWPLGEATTPLSRAGKYRLSFANVDDRLTLWVNRRAVRFAPPQGAADAALPGAYQFDIRGDFHQPTAADLSPVGIGVRGADVRISHLLLERDIYYTRNDEEIHRNSRPELSNPEEYANLHTQSEAVYELGEDEFFVLGDNSPRSADSRHWKGRLFHPYAVPRNLLIGKAFFVYWPHGIPFGNNGRGYAIGTPPLNALFYQVEWDDDTQRPRVSKDYPAFTVPFYPQVARMQRIR